MDRITALAFETTYGRTQVVATLSDETTVELFSYYADELTFTEADLIGKSVEEARALRHRRDVAYLRS